MCLIKFLCITPSGLSFILLKEQIYAAFELKLAEVIKKEKAAMIAAFLI